MTREELISKLVDEGYGKEYALESAKPAEEIAKDSGKSVEEWYLYEYENRIGLDEYTRRMGRKTP
jgi:hypothetical protein